MHNPAENGCAKRFLNRTAVHPRRARLTAYPADKASLNAADLRLIKRKALNAVNYRVRRCQCPAAYLREFSTSSSPVLVITPV